MKGITTKITLLIMAFAFSSCGLFKGGGGGGHCPAYGTSLNQDNLDVDNTNPTYLRLKETKSI